MCRNYKPRDSWKPTLSLNQSTEEFFQDADMGRAQLTETLENNLPLEKRVVAPFIACGSLSSYDSDATYSIEHGKQTTSLDPVQLPTAPPYKKALEMKRRGLLRG